MRINDLITKLEGGRSTISEAKVKVANLLFLNSIDFNLETQKKFNSAINNINKTIVSIYTSIQHEVPYVEYSDKTPYFKGKIILKDGYRFDSEISRCIGLLNFTSESIKEVIDVNEVIDHASMQKTKLNKDVSKLIKDAIKNVKEVVVLVSGISLNKVEDSNEVSVTDIKITEVKKTKSKPSKKSKPKVKKEKSKK